MDAESVKLRYFREQIEKGIRDVFAAQREIADERIYPRVDRWKRVSRSGRTYGGRSGALRDALANPKYMVDVGDGVKAESTVPKYIRFLDMKRYGNHRIYNRPVWGILYNQTMQNIKYEFRDWLWANFRDLRDQLYNQITNQK